MNEITRHREQLYMPEFLDFDTGVGKCVESITSSLKKDQESEEGGKKGVVVVAIFGAGNDVGKTYLAGTLQGKVMEMGIQYEVLENPYPSEISIHPETKVIIFKDLNMVGPAKSQKQLKELIRVGRNKLNNFLESFHLYDIKVISVAIQSENAKFNIDDHPVMAADVFIHNEGATRKPR